MNQKVDFELDSRILAQVREFCTARNITQAEFLQAAIEDKLNRFGSGE